MFSLGSSKRLSLKQAHANLTSNTEIVVIDVRTSSEFYGNGHIKNAINIAVDQIGEQIEKIITNKNTTIYLVCQSGTRSAMAYSILKRLSYTHVFDLGSIVGWPAKLEFK